MGRPKRQHDEELTRDLEKLVADAGSMRRAAKFLKIDATTLGRSLEKRAFSKATRARILAVRGGGEGISTSAKSSISDAAETRAEALQMLQKTSTLLHQALERLEAVEARLESFPDVVPGHSV